MLAFAACLPGCDGDNWSGTTPCPILNQWINTNQDMTVYMEVRVRRTDGACTMAPATGQTTGAAVNYKGTCYVAVADSLTFDEARLSCEQSGMILARIEAPDVESFVETHLLRNAPSNNLWIGLAKASNGPWAWLNQGRYYWEDFVDGAPTPSGAACASLEHSATSDIDQWRDNTCDSRTGGYICMKATGLAVPEATGLFKLFVTSMSGEQAAPEDPPLWNTVLWARSGYNTTAAAELGAFADPHSSGGQSCVNMLDVQNQNATQCDIMQTYGFDCLTYFCPNCEYAGYCDAKCGYCGDVPPPQPAPPPPQQPLIIPEPEPEPWIHAGDPLCFDAYDAAGGTTVSQTPNRCDYYMTTDPNYVQQYAADGLTPLGDAVQCLLGTAQLADAATCESRMRTAPDDPALSACVYTPAPPVTSQCQLMLQVSQANFHLAACCVLAVYCMHAAYCAAFQRPTFLDLLRFATCRPASTATPGCVQTQSPARTPASAT